MLSMREYQYAIAKFKSTIKKLLTFSVSFILLSLRYNKTCHTHSVHIRQLPHAHVTTITYVHMMSKQSSHDINLILQDLK